MKSLGNQLWFLKVIPWQILLSAYLAIVLLIMTVGSSTAFLGQWLPFLLIAYLLWLAFKISGIFNSRGRMGNVIYVITTLLTNPSIRIVFGETAFDCATTGIKVATYDLLNTAPCPEYQSIYRTKVMRRAQLLQRDASKLVDAVQCQLLVQREHCYCGDVFSTVTILLQPKSSLPYLSMRGNAAASFRF